MDMPSKKHRIFCSCVAEPEAYLLRTSFKLLAEYVKDVIGLVPGPQESDRELVGRALMQIKGKDNG